MNKTAIAVASAAILAASAWAGHAQDTSMSFFITSQGPGDGANLGGLAGADRQCTILADAAGVTGKTWRAYLSTSTVNARDRVGNGPWYNAKSVMIAANLAALHSDANAIDKSTGPERKRRADQRPWRLSKSARHPDRLQCQRPWPWPIKHAGLDQ